METISHLFAACFMSILVLALGLTLFTGILHALGIIKVDFTERDGYDR